MAIHSVHKETRIPSVHVDYFMSFQFEKCPIWKVPELEWYPNISLYPDLLLFIGLSVSDTLKKDL